MTRHKGIYLSNKIDKIIRTSKTEETILKRGEGKGVLLCIKDLSLSFLS